MGDGRSLASTLIADAHERGRAELAAEVRAHLEASIAKLNAADPLTHSAVIAAKRAALVDELAWITERSAT